MHTINVIDNLFACHFTYDASNSCRTGAILDECLVFGHTWPIERCMAVLQRHDAIGTDVESMQLRTELRNRQQISLEYFIAYKRDDHRLRQQTNRAQTENRQRGELFALPGEQHQWIGFRTK